MVILMESPPDIAFIVLQQPHHVLRKIRGNTGTLGNTGSVERRF
jgi:hypothetical protein